MGSAGEGDTKRFRCSAGQFAGDDGWEHETTFWAFENEKPGTIPIALGHADYEEGGWNYPYRSGTCRLRRRRLELSLSLWDMQTTKKEVGTIPIALGHADYE